MSAAALALCARPTANKPEYHIKSVAYQND
jgi:hypothetical protein